jgi:hypothetical protein
MRPPVPATILTPVVAPVIAPVDPRRLGRAGQVRTERGDRVIPAPRARRGPPEGAEIRHISLEHQTVAAETRVGIDDQPQPAADADRGDAVVELLASLEAVVPQIGNLVAGEYLVGVALKPGIAVEDGDRFLPARPMVVTAEGIAIRPKRLVRGVRRIRQASFLMGSWSGSSRRSAQARTTPAPCDRYSGMSFHRRGQPGLAARHPAVCRRHSAQPPATFALLPGACVVRPIDQPPDGSKHTNHMKHPLRSILLAAACTAGLVITANNATAAEPGYVDFGAALAGVSSTKCVEVNLPEPLLAFAATVAKGHDADAAALIKDLRQVRVNVLGIARQEPLRAHRPACRRSAPTSPRRAGCAPSPCRTTATMSPSS